MDNMNNVNGGLDSNGQGIDLSKDTSGQQYTQTNQYGQTGQQQSQAYGQAYGQAGQQEQNYGQAGQANDFTNNQYGQNGQGFNQFSGQPNGVDAMGAMAGGMIAMNAPDYMLWLVLGIVQICTICCCNCTALVTGIITVVLTVMANKSYKMGNAIDYQTKMKIAKIVCCVGYGLMVIGWIISLFTGMLDMIIEMFNI